MPCPTLLVARRAILDRGQLIVFEGHPLTAVYFINRGYVQLMQRMHPVGTLRDNDNFGLDDYVLALDEAREPTVSLTARAVGYCDVMTLAIDKLDEIAGNDEVFREARAQRQSAREQQRSATKNKGRKGAASGFVAGCYAKAAACRLRRASSNSPERARREQEAAGASPPAGSSPPSNRKGSGSGVDAPSPAAILKRQSTTGDLEPRSLSLEA